VTIQRGRAALAIDGWGRDVRYALRLLTKTPGFTLTAAATLALAIGVNTAVFSVADGVLFAPLPYPRPTELALVSRTVTRGGAGSTGTAVNGRTWELLRDGEASFKRAVFSTWVTGVNFAAASENGTGSARFVQQQRVGAAFFDVLGVPPAYGREFNADEDRSSGPRAAILSAALWRSAFDGNPSAVGRSILLRGEPHTIVGIMPDGFETGERADLWTPLRASSTGEGGGENYHVLVRFEAGSEPAARAAIALVGDALARERPQGEDDDVRVSFATIPLQQGLTSGIRQPLAMLACAFALVLVAACVNLAGLMLARASARRHEIATRLALGSGRAAIVRQMLVEALLLGAIAGAAGLIVASLTLDAFRWLARDTFDVWQSVSLGGRAVAVAASVSIAASVAIGIGGARHAARQPASGGLAGHRAIAGLSSRWPRRVLVAAQVALAVLLLTASGVLVRTFDHLQRLDPGFDPHNLRTASISLDDARYRTAESVSRLLDESVARMKAMPGVESAAATLGLPYQRILNLGFRHATRVTSRQAQTGITSATYVTPEFFAAMRIPIRRGRSFDDRDREGAPPVAIVNASFVRTYFGDADPIGHRIGIAGADREIVGVAGDVQLRPGWGEFGPLAAMPLAYFPVHQIADGFARLVHGWFQPAFVVRASAAAGTDVVRAAVQQVDPMLPIASLRSMTEIRADAVALQRLLMILLLSLAAAAVVVSTIGIHGLISTTVVERTREMGIRVALGATTGQALRALALPGIALACVGTAIGLALALASARFVRHFVWGVSATDPLTFSVVAVVVMIVASAASFAPARRILSLDPAVTLRHE
jgi:predicted permease